MRTPDRRDATSLEVKMTPMIDVVFLLLVFFVWTSSFDTPEFDLPSSIAQPPQGIAPTDVSDSVPEPFDEIVIELRNLQGVLSIQMNGNSIANLDALREQLREVFSLGVQPPVIVDPEGDVTMDHAIEVYDVARAAGGDRVLFAAKEDGETSALGAGGPSTNTNGSAGASR